MLTHDWIPCVCATLFWILLCNVLFLTGFKTLEVIHGKVDAYLHTTIIKKWDICAGDALLRSVGGEMTTLTGEKIDYSATTNPKNGDGLLATLYNHDKYFKKLKRSGK